MLARRAAVFSSLSLLVVSAAARAEEPTSGYHPWVGEHVRPLELDARELVAHPERYIGRPGAQPDLHPRGELEATPERGPGPGLAGAGRAPEGWVQRGGVIVPEVVARGEVLVDPDVAYGMQIVPGSEYPRKHTLFINFNGGMLFVGPDNSAENTSTLARQGVYPLYEGGEQKAMSIVQAVEADVAPYGIVVKFGQRPNNTVPYTMVMIGGQWTDVNTDRITGGIAPGADCGALGQRHVVYAFDNIGTTVTRLANTASQEAGHAWGLDHTFNCDSVMSYCSLGDVGFSETCDELCEVDCQGPGSVGCRLMHEEFCGEGSNQQNEAAVLSWLFGGDEPDMEPPRVEIMQPEDGTELEAGDDVRLRTLISDNYGGYGWYYYVTRDGEVVADFVDYGRQVDDNYIPALNLTELTPGVWVFTVGAEDHFGHITEDSVTVFVGDAEPTETADASADGSQSEDGGRGCACQGSAPGGPGGASMWLLGLFALRRRIRACA